MVKNSILPPMYANFYFNMLVYVGGLEYCTPNCTVCVLVHAEWMRSSCRVRQDHILYMLHDFCKVTWLISRLTLDRLLVSYTMCSVQPSHYTTTVCRSVIKFKTVLPHSVVQINGLNILARLLMSPTHLCTAYSPRFWRLEQKNV